MLRRKADFRGGYTTIYFFLNRLFNILVSVSLIAVSFPAFILVALAILFFEGRPILFKGKRLGLGKKPFTIYKFRTLVPDADKMTGAEALSARDRLVTPIGKFLRNTRLDELPQLFNVLRGDMDFFGPRPHRREIYESIGRNVQRYERRFAVKPGLVGYPALFLTYNAPRQMQSSLDNMFLWRKQRISFEVFIILYTVLVVARKAFVKASRFLWSDVIKSRILRLYSQKRALERLKFDDATVRFLVPGGDSCQEAVGKLVDINEKAFLAEVDGSLAAADGMELELVIDREVGRGRRKHKVARCRGIVYRKSPRDDGKSCSYVIEYTPVSPFNCYIVNQYFLEGSIVS